LRKGRSPIRSRSRAAVSGPTALLASRACDCSRSPSQPLF
jgi:hypothetical protein